MQRPSLSLPGEKIAEFPIRNLEAQDWPEFPTKQPLAARLTILDPQLMAKRIHPRMSNIGVSFNWFYRNSCGMISFRIHRIYTFHGTSSRFCGASQLTIRE